MPTSGVHITVLELVAREPGLTEALSGDDDSPRLAYAKLGAIGPDVFYALADFGPGLQDMVNYLVKSAGAFECLLDLIDEADKTIKKVEDKATFGLSKTFSDVMAEFETAIGLVGSAIHSKLMSLLVDNGINLFPFVQSPRQQDRPREDWFWADTLHYVRTGQFTKALLVNSKDNPLHRAYAMGYATHYVTDVVGHPYINQIVRSPWRMYWQRHHLVENFVDVYAWARWHDRAPESEAEDEPPLDVLRDDPRNDFVEGPSFTNARLNDHVDIGIVRGNDPVDALIHEICEKIRKGLFEIGLAERDPDPVDDEDLRSWAEFMVRSIKETYPADSRPPRKLEGLGRPDGYPTAEDILSAYSLFRLILRISTENRIVEPVFPDIAKDIWDEIRNTWNKLLEDLGGLPNPMPFPGVNPGHVSMKSVWASIMDWAKRVVEFAEKLGKAAINYIRNSLRVVGVAIVDVVKAGLYLFKKALFDMYMAFRHVLVRAGYAMPLINELQSDIGPGVPATQLWVTPSDNMDFPFEELPGLQRAWFGSRYVPWVYPSMLEDMPASPYVEKASTFGDVYGYNARPESFIEMELGPRRLMSHDGVQDIHGPRDSELFGGAVDNCGMLLRRFLDAEMSGHIEALVLPDYNLDGDRGYAWPCWEQSRPPFPDGRQFDPLSPGPGRPVVSVDPVVIRPDIAS